MAENPVKRIEEIDVKITELEQEKELIASNHHEELVEHDLRVINKVINCLENGLKLESTKTEVVEEVVELLEEVASDVKTELKKLRSCN